jgi:hypothetical protein
LIAARIIRDAMSESQATSERRGGICVICVIGVTHTTREGHGGDGGEVQKIVATWNARQAGSVCFLSQRRTGSRITVIIGARRLAINPWNVSRPWRLS